MDKNRSISEKYSLDYYRHSLPTRAWKSRWNYFALLLAVLAFVSMYVVARNRTFQAAPVASVHSSFAANCSACHDKSWGAGRRMVAASNEQHSVSNQSCQRCHQASKHAGIPLTEPMCVECHQEHRPEKRLTEIANTACTRCHADLKAAVAEVSFAANIGQFEAGKGGHPEFAILRSTRKGIGPRHPASAVAEFKLTRGEEGKWLDRGGLKFTHALHLDATQMRGPDRKPAKLGCGDCHVVASDGYMQPVNYENHCSKCHPLRLAGPFAGLDDLPHSAVEEVRGVIRERLAKQLQSAPQKASQPELQFPRLPKPPRLTADAERELSSQAERAEHAIFGPEAKGACSRCHHFELRDGDWVVHMQNPAVVSETAVADPKRKAEMVPSRWLTGAKFDHKSHRAVECISCHDVSKSKQTSDILLPSISVCRDCHGSSAHTSRPHVSADCVLCHTYHMQPNDKNSHGMPLDKLFLNANL